MALYDFKCEAIMLRITPGKTLDTVFVENPVLIGVTQFRKIVGSFGRE